MWIEEAFRDLKSHGWQLEDATLDCPERMAHLWLILVVTYAWLLLWGSALEAAHATLAPKRRADGACSGRAGTPFSLPAPLLTCCRPLSPHSGGKGWG